MNNILIERAVSYCKLVVDGSFISNPYVVKQCEIFLRDLESCIDGTNEKFIFTTSDLDIAEGVIKLLHFPDGDMLGEPIIDYITGFQCLIIVALLGFRYKDRPTKRRYETFVILMARKNAKTFICSLITIIMMFLEKKGSAMYSVSVDKNLSGISRKMIKDMLEYDKNHWIGEQFYVPKTKPIECKLNGNTFQNMCGDADKLNGYLPKVTILDEVGQYKNSDLINVIRSGTKSVENKTFFYCSTAYATDSKVFQNQIDFLKSILEGETSNDSYFGLLYQGTDEELWDTEEQMRMANPMSYYNDNFMTSLYEDINLIKTNADEGLKEEFLTKNLNIFLPDNGGTSYVTDEQIQKCIIDEYDFTGKKCYIGLDLANSTDLTGISILHYDKNADHWYAQGWGILPKSKIYEKSKKDGINYTYAERRGWVFAEGDRGVIDYQFVENFILDLKSNVKLQYLAIDRNYGQNIIQRLDDKGLYIEDIPQGFKGQDEAVRTLRELILEEKISIVRNSVFEYCFRNCMVQTNNTEQMMLSKKESNRNGRIDIVMALINAVASKLKVDQESYTFRSEVV